MKGPPKTVTALPAYASAGLADRSTGLAKIWRTLIALLAFKVEGLLKAICTVQFPAVATSALTAKIVEEFNTAHAGPGIPHTETEQF
jgi:hypothetical protein